MNFPSIGARPGCIGCGLYLVWPSILLFAPRRYFLSIFLGLVSLSPISRFVALWLGQSLDFYRTLPNFQMGGVAMLMCAPIPAAVPPEPVRASSSTSTASCR